MIHSPSRRTLPIWAGSAGRAISPTRPTSLSTSSSGGSRSVDLVAGGPPCQPFSRAGSAKIRSLVARGAGRGRSAGLAVEQLHGGGGAAQAQGRAGRERARSAVLGRRRGSDRLLRVAARTRATGRRPRSRRLPTRGSPASGPPLHRRDHGVAASSAGRSRSRSTPTLRDAIGDLPPAPPAQREEVSRYLGSPESPLARRLRRGLRGEAAREISRSHHPGRAPRRPRGIRLMPEGGTYADLPEQPASLPQRHLHRQVQAARLG